VNAEERSHVNSARRSGDSASTVRSSRASWLLTTSILGDVQTIGPLSVGPIPERASAAPPARICCAQDDREQACDGRDEMTATPGQATLG
jgi:hypothetical protein